jgi:hypothetical protein
MTGSTPTGSIDPFYASSHEQTESAVALQMDALDAYERASRLWLERVKSELELWSELGAKLTSACSVNDALEAYATSVALRMQMTIADGQRLFDECREVTQQATCLPRDGLPKRKSM